MKPSLLKAGRRLVLPPHRAVVRLVAAEVKISFYHHKGLWKIQRERLCAPKKLNLGAGDLSKEGFLNVDLFPGGDLTLDLRRGLPFASDCCETIFSEHFFEHLDYPEPIGQLLRDCLRVLRPAGTLTFSVPDAEWPLNDYSRGLEAPYFRTCEEYHWHPNCTTRIEHINFHFRQFGQHLFAYDEETMRKLLNAVGFVDVRKREFDPELDSERRRVGSLFIEARKR